LPDDTIVGVLLAGRRKGNMKVYTIEQGDPGLGVGGIKNWRTQNLEIQTARDSE
jgi:hypothetical protein